MYNQFIKKIKANIDSNLGYKNKVESHPFIIKYNGKDISKDINEYIRKSKDASKDILALIASDKIAALQYMGSDPGKSLDRRKKLLEFNSNLPLSYLEDLDYALYYIINVLHGNLSLDSEFATEFINKVIKDISSIPSVLYILPYNPKTEEYCNLLITYLIKYYTDNKNALTEGNTIFKEFIQALEYKNILKELFAQNENFRELCREFYKMLKITPDPTEGQFAKGQSSKDNIFNIDMTELSELSADDVSAINIFVSKLNSIINSSAKKEDFKTLAQSQTDINDDLMIKFIDEKRNDLNSISADIDNILNLIDSISSNDKFTFFKNFLESMKKNLQQINTGSTDNNDSKNDNQSISVNGSTANIRGKKMFKLAKAYTRYYIKNMLPNMLRCAGNDPEATSKVIKVSTDEIQDLMYGDTINHPENLSEVNNPAVRDQIASDVEQAVKGDQISGGAADGLSIEDIAKKWSEIYKQVPYEHLLDVLKTQEQAGSIVEQEHTDNLEIAKEIARDHLVEAPDYYTHLENMEEVFPAENVSERPLPEPEGMDLQTLDNPLPKNEEHVCDGSCGGNCKCHHDKVQTVEDKIKGLDGDGMMIIMVEETPEVETVEEQPLEFIQQIAAKIKR